MSVATIRGAAIKHHILNSVLYSMSVCPGQWAKSTGGSQSWNKKYVITHNSAAFHVKRIKEGVAGKGHVFVNFVMW